MKAHISGFAPELEKAIYEEAAKQCDGLIQAQSGDILRRCFNLMLLACANTGLAPRTGRRIKTELDQILPAWEQYALTGDGDDAVQHHLEEKGFPFYQITDRM